VNWSRKRLLLKKSEACGAETKPVVLSNNRKAIVPVEGRL